MQARESTKIPRLQRALQEFDENFDVIGLINFNWDHTVIRSPSHQLAGRKTPEPKSTIIKNKYAVRYPCWPGEDVQIVRHGSEDNARASATSPA